MLSEDVQRNTITYDTAIIACEKGWRPQCSAPGRACEKGWRLLLVRRALRNMITYDTAIIACEKCWRRQQALELFERGICESEKSGIVEPVLEICIEKP